MDVIIIGAGMAGLAAADGLAKAGIKPLVIEARDRVGGRIQTIRDNGVHIELGAEFVHGRPPEIFELARQFGLAITPSGGSFINLPAKEGTPTVVNGPSGGDQAVWQKLESFAKSSSADITLAEFIQRQGRSISASERESLERFVSGFHAAELDKIGVRSIVDTEKAEEAIGGLASFRIEGGYDRLTESLRSRAESLGAKFLLNHRVICIRWRNGHAAVEMESGTFETKTETAAAVIVTLPLSLLKNGGPSPPVRFEPKLAAKGDALSRLHMGAASRVSFICRSRWWDEALKRLGHDDVNLGFLISQREVPVSVWWSDDLSEAPVLTGWSGGKNAAKLSTPDKSIVLDQALKSLQEIFRIDRKEVEADIVSSHFHDWQNDPFEFGSYSYPGVEGLSAMRDLAKPIEDTLFFAGEATSYDGFWGTVHGALASGIRAAREVAGSR